MNILQFTIGFKPADAWGGPGRIVHQNSLDLIRRGHRVTVCCTNLLDKKSKIASKTSTDTVDGIYVIYFNVYNFPNWPGTLGPVWSPDMVEFFRKKLAQFDLVHIHGYRNLLALPAVYYCRRHHVPYIVQPHGDLPAIANSIQIKRLYDSVFGRLELESMSALIALQETEKQQAIQLGVPEAKIEVIPNGIDASRAIPVHEIGQFRKRYDIPENVPLFLFLGRINQIKGPDMLIEAFCHFRDTDACLAIVGPDDGQLDEVKSLIQGYHLESKVKIIGLLSEEDVGSAYQDSDILVMPSRKDAFPATIVEACKYGLPMVITDRCEIADLVKDRIALVVPFDADLFAQGMKQVLDNKELYTYYQNNCPAVLKDTFSIKNTIDKLENLYHRVVQDHNGRLQ